MLCAGAILAGLMPGAANAAGSLIFADGFESGTLLGWNGSSGTTVQQGVVYQGTRAARATSDGTVSAYAYKNFSPVSEVYYDGRFNVISQGSTTNASLVRFRTAAVGSILTMLRRSDGRLAYFNEVTGVTTIGPAVSTGGWHELEVHVLINGTSSLIETWVDGTIVSALSKTDSLGTTAIGRIYIGDPSSGRTFDFAFDNEVISTSSDVYAPTIPGSLTATTVGSVAVDLNWTASTDNVGVTGYAITRNGVQIATVGGGTTTYHDANVVSGTTYTYTVDAFDAAANHSPPSNSATVTPISDVQAPTVPTGLAATPVNPTRVDLTWNASTDNIGVTGYTVYRDGAQIGVVNGSTTTFSDVNASPATQYSYTVDAFDAAANHSAQSSPAVTTTPALPANLSAPTISGAAIVGQTLIADRGTWSGTEPISYTYQWRSCDTAGSNCADISGATGQTYTLVQGDLGKTVRVSVTGTNPFGSSAASSDPTDVVDDEATPPSNTSLPTISGAALVGHTLTADPGEWTGTEPIDFEYQWRTCDASGADCADIFGETQDTYTLTTLDVGSTIRVAVTASNIVGSQVATSNATAVVTEEGPTPPSNTAPPTISGVTNVGQTLTADPGTWTGTQPITFTYQWRNCNQNGGNCVDISGATQQAYTLVPGNLGKTIRVTVTASNTAGSATTSSAATAIVVDATAPTIPTNLNATAVSANRVDLTWTASTDDVGVAGYTIYRGGTQIATVSGTTTYSDTTVTGSTTYTYTVDAFDAAQNHSAQSAPKSVTTPPGTDGTPPSVPTGLSATVITTNRVDLTWNASTDNMGVTGYTVYRNGAVLANVGGGTLAFSDQSAVAGVSYSYTVDAFDAAGNHSAQSSSANVLMPGTIFSDGFEGGNMSQWNASSAMTVQQQVVLAGTRAARATTTGTPAAYAYKNLSPTLSELYYDGGFNIISQGNSTTASIVRFRTAAVGSILTILRKNNGRLAYFNEVTGVTTTGPAVSEGAWHDLEVHVRINGANSFIEVWLDGTIVFSQTDSLGTTPVGRIYIGDPSTGRTFDFAFDQQVISTAADVTPPTAPTGVAAVPLGSGRLNVTWNPSTDNNQVFGYTLYRNGVARASLGPITTGYADTGLQANTTYTYTVEARDAAGNRSALSSPGSGTTGAPTSGDPVIAAVGDIACDPTDSRFNGGQGTASACKQLAVSNIFFNTPLGAMLPLGDNQYEDGTQFKYMQSYDGSFGRVMSFTRPVPGNHEYLTQNAAGYFAYFGSLAGDPTKGYYSYDIGTWHIIALNSECAFIGGCGASSPQTAWLINDLATHSNACTLAYWHRPRFSSGEHGNDDTFATWWFRLYSAGADIVLNGHDHNYERFAPQNDNQQPDANGIREFIVGTGGEELGPFTTQAANSVVFNNNSFGALKLTLHSTSYDWQFVPAAGSTFTDSGTGSCH